MNKLKKARYSKKQLKAMIDEYLEAEGVKSLAGLALYLKVDIKTLKSWDADVRTSIIC